MPIDHKNKFIFVHIPKAGGTSIERLFNIDKRKNLYQGLDGIRHNGVSFSLQHLTAKQLKKHPETKKYFNNYFKFSFVRNPYDRILSEYFWLHRINKIGMKDTPENFKIWVKKFLKKMDKDHKLPQYQYLYDNDDNLMVDFIGKIETINDDFKEVLKKIKHREISLPHHNKNKKNKEIKDSYLTEEIKDIIYDIYKKDFELFSYKR